MFWFLLAFALTLDDNATKVCLAVVSAIGGLVHVTFTVLHHRELRKHSNAAEERWKAERASEEKPRRRKRI